MAAWRQIHDDVPISGTLGALTDAAERLYWRMLSKTDQWGRLTGDLAKLRALVIPTLPWEDDKFARTVVELNRKDAIDRYATDWIWVVQIVNFDDRQSFSASRRAPSRFPEKRTDSTTDDDQLLQLNLTVQKTPATTGEPRQETETERTEEVVLPTAEARTPARGLSIRQTLQDSLDHAALSTSGLRVPAAGLTSVPTSDLTGEPGVSVGGFGSLPAAGFAFPPEDLRSVVARLRDADEGTVNVLVRLRERGLPQGAFLAALESLDERRKRKPALRSDVRYVVGALKTMLAEGHYGKGAAA